MQQKDLVIIGRGPAALTAGLYAARAAVDAVLIGGWTPLCQVMTTLKIENFPGFPEGITGPDLIDKIESQARKFNLEILGETVRGITPIAAGFQLETESTVFEAKSVIVATGAMPGTLDVEGEDRLRGKGVCYCATCDGPLYRDMVIAVVGGGEAAVKEAEYLTRFASKVYVVHRRTSFRAVSVEVERLAQNPKIELVLDSVVKKIHGDALVTGLTLVDVVSGAEKWLEVDGIFIYIGIKPNSALVAHLVEVDERGFILVGKDMSTSLPGMFAAGDVCSKKLRQIVTAVADGAIACNSSLDFLSRGKDSIAVSTRLR